MIPMSPAEIADRYTIVKLKKDNTKLDTFDEELKILWEEIIELLDSKVLLDSDLTDLRLINMRIWDYEEEIAKIGKTDIAKVGEILLKINENNARRTDLKRAISERTKTGYFDFKIGYYY